MSMVDIAWERAISVSLKRYIWKEKRESSVREIYKRNLRAGYDAKIGYKATMTKFVEA